MRCSVLLSLLTVAGCAPVPLGEGPSDTDVQASSLTLAERKARSDLIRTELADHGITNPLLFAGLASAETNMAHCWSEATWACQGPASSDCGGGPVIAGSADGPCRNRQGGLGMFQFDAGTHDETLRREGSRILSIRGSVAAAVEFIVEMVRGSAYVADVSTSADAVGWINRVRPDSAEYEDWITTIVRYYNGCVPGRCSRFNARYRHYDGHVLDRYEELGHDYWYRDAVVPFDDPPPAPLCLPLRTSCSGGDRCCDDASCRAGVTFGTRCCAEASQPCPGGDADCCGAMVCNAGRCEANAPGKGCVHPDDCQSRLCYDAVCY